MASTKVFLESVREDDFVEYFLFPIIETNVEIEQEKFLTTILIKAEGIIRRYCEDYIWHKDEFKLTVRTSISNVLSSIEGKTENLPPHLYGVSHYGDNIEDEWFMVFLLRELTKEITGLIARVHDADGEFLLIEAADFLPAWANPDICQNRVYLYDGDVHMVPPEREDDRSISVMEALAKIREDPSITIANPEVQNSIKNKLSIYPENIKTNMHRARAYVPIAVAAILKHDPKLIAHAVRAFCMRDTLDLRACRAMKYFPPENRILTTITFTRCLYAMITHSKYFPDRVTGWKLPPLNSKDYKCHMLGVKIACGFEILASQAKPSSNDVSNDKAWSAYVKALTEKGYFKGLLEHSKDYDVLLDKAKEFYLNHRNSMHYSTSVGHEVLTLIKTLDNNIEEVTNDLPEDDDESWLNVSPEELDKMLQEKYGQKTPFNLNNNSDASNFTEKITTFLNQVSDVEGVELLPEQTTKKDTKIDSNKINFDADAFGCAVQNILNFVIPEDDSWNDTDSDLSEYEHDICPSENLENVKTKMQKYMEQMDRELAATTIGESFEKKNDTFEDIEDFKPVDIDVNALKNILESYKSEMGEAGPSSTMLGSVGVRFDPKTEMDVD